MVDKPDELRTKQNFSYPTIDRYVEKWQLKEAENVELGKNEHYLQRFMSFVTRKVDVSEVMKEENHKSNHMMMNYKRLA